MGRDQALQQFMSVIVLYYLYWLAWVEGTTAVVHVSALLSCFTSQYRLCSLLSAGKQRHEIRGLTVEVSSPTGLCLDTFGSFWIKVITN